jgi:TolB-like protein/Flp pilus assembly protein TadD
MGYRGHPDRGPVLRQLERILASEGFARSERLSEFLRFTVVSVLDGRPDDLKEYAIALSVFHRPESYNPKIDSIVRVEAGKLRSKLAHYYETEGRGDAVRIEIPKGSYVPAFRPASREQRPVLNRRLGIAAAVLAAAILVSLAAHRLANAPRRAPHPAGTLSIAVLPFLDLTASKDKEYLCDGLTEELITNLAGLPGLQIASRTSVFQYKGNTGDIRRVGEALNVQAVLEGSVRMKGGRIRVISQLITTSDGFHIWTDTYEGEAAGMSDVQQIADSIFRSFRMDLKSTRRALVRPPSRSAEAWRHYIRAEQLRTREPLKAVEFYGAAVTEDPNYALAWSGMSLALLTAADWGEAANAEVLPKAAEAAGRALAAHAGFAESHVAAGQVKVCQKQDWAGAEKSFRRAIEIDPTYLEARLEYARMVLLPTGRFSQAVQELKRGLALYPDSNLLLNELANAHIKARRYGDAFEPLQASHRISRSQLAAWVFLGMAETGLGRFEEALQSFSAAAALRRTPWVVGHLGYIYAKLGRAHDAQDTILELEKKREGKTAYDYDVAAVRTALGEVDAAFAALDRALANQSLDLIWIKVDYRFDALRTDPRFGLLARRMRLE